MSDDAPLRLFYDGDCPFCVREVRWLAGRDRRGALEVVDIASPEFDPSPYGRTREEFMARIHARRADGTLFSGMQVFREAYAAVGLGWLLAPTGWWPLRPLFDLVYAAFARHRVRLGRLLGRSCEDGRCDLAPPARR